jgi:hypothetical protein
MFPNLQGFPKGSTPVLKLVSTDFPALQSFMLRSMPIPCADLSSPSACSQLMHLDLLSCQLQKTGAGSTTSPLSALHSLKQLSVSDSSVAAGLTQLTGLSLKIGHPYVAATLGDITGCTQLQHSELSSTTFYMISAEQIVSILTSCKQLTGLALYCVLRQPAFDALLTRGTHLTSLTCSQLCLEEDRSASPCSWKELVMAHKGLDPETFICIPTGSLTRLAYEDKALFPSPCPTLDVISHGMTEPDNLPQIVHHALINLNRCPAWQQCGPGVTVHLFWYCVHGVLEEKLNLLLSALAPLVGKEVSLTCQMLLQMHQQSSSWVSHWAAA